MNALMKYAESIPDAIEAHMPPRTSMPARHHSATEQMPPSAAKTMMHFRTPDHRMSAG